MNNYLDSLSLPNEDYQMLSKRQKLDIINLPKLDPSTVEPVSEEEWSGLTREFVALRRSLLQTEVTACQFRKVRVQIEEVIREEERNLEIYLGMNRGTAKQVEVSLGTTMWSALEIREAEAIAEAEMAQIKIRMREKFMNLLMENPSMNASSRGDIATFPMMKNNDSDIERELREAENNIDVELACMLKGEWASQEFNCDKLEEASIKFQRLHSQRAILDEIPILSSKVGHANRLEGEIQSERYINPILREAEDNLVFNQQEISIREGLEDGGKVEQQLIFLPGKSDELSSSFQWKESRETETWLAGVPSEEPLPPLAEMISIQMDQRADAEESASLWVQPDASLYSSHNEVPAAEALDLSLPCPRLKEHEENCRVERTCQDLRIAVGSYYVLASDPQYFLINWETHYKQDLDNKYICNMCLAAKNSKGKIQDHIWFKHFGGGFICPLCPELRALSTRDGVGVHIKRFHPTAFPQKKTNKPTKNAKSLW